MPPETDNLQLTELFQQDQKDREKPLDSPQALQKLWARDEERRKRVYGMMSMKEIRTKDDLFHAGVILYHGQDTADFITAHRLAALAAVMGRKDARWLLAASFDRFIMRVGMPQIYGTQFEYNSITKQYELKLPMEEPVMLDFEKDFLGVPSIAERLQELNRQILS